MDLSKILALKYPGSEWALDGNDYEGLIWLSDSVKPTKAELEAHWPDVEYQTTYAEVEKDRAEAYRETSDPIFFQYQRGDATEAEWLAAVEAVKAAHPYPEA
jgi:hypothetical protein